MFTCELAKSAALGKPFHSPIGWLKHAGDTEIIVAKLQLILSIFSSFEKLSFPPCKTIIINTQFLLLSFTEFLSGILQCLPMQMLLEHSEIERAAGLSKSNNTRDYWNSFLGQLTYILCNSFPLK